MFWLLNVNICFYRVLRNSSYMSINLLILGLHKDLTLYFYFKKNYMKITEYKYHLRKLCNVPAKLKDSTSISKGGVSLGEQLITVL